MEEAIKIVIQENIGTMGINQEEIGIIQEGRETSQESIIIIQEGT